MSDRISNDPRFKKVIFLFFFSFFFLFCDPDISFAVKVLTDVRFKRRPKKEEKEEEQDDIDKDEDRFGAIFTDERFAVGGKVDSRGRKVEKKVGDEYKKFYGVKGKKAEEEEEDDKAKNKEQKKSLFDLARGGGDDPEDSSSSSDIDDLLEEENDRLMQELERLRSEKFAAVEMEDDAPPTRRLACVGLDWDVFSATDILAVVRSFCPPQGSVKSVAVYPSNFGKERMAYEEENGPYLKDAEEAMRDMGEGKTLEEQEEALENLFRVYEGERRRYYFAVIECDSPETAAHLYENCDDRDIFLTSCSMDLRFIPDDQEFDQESKREEATFVPLKYMPPDMTAEKDGTGTTKIELNWDKTAQNRTRKTMRPITADELDEADVADLLASASEDEGEDGADEYGQDGDEEDELRIEGQNDDESKKQKLIEKHKKREERVREKVRARYAVLLEGIDDAVGEKEEMIVTFQSGLEEQAEEALKERDRVQKESNMTPFELKQAERAARKKEKKELRKAKLEAESKAKEQARKEHRDAKKREKKKAKQGLQEEEDEATLAKRAELEMLVMGEKKYGSGRDVDDEEEQGDGQDAAADVVEDERFSSIFDRPEYAIDPTDQRFHPSATMDKMLGKMREKHGKRERTIAAPEDEQGPASSKRELQDMVSNIKRKQKMQKK